jgi:methenyltetrahydrofolate cyclohydrolase
MSPSSIDQHTIGDWLDQLGAKSPTPGGGSVAALVGAIGSALGMMVLAYSRGKKAHAQHEELFNRGSQQA